MRADVGDAAGLGLGAPQWRAVGGGRELHIPAGLNHRSLPFSRTATTRSDSIGLLSRTT